ncbi:LysM peptidoglycan-binding domain-containing protein [Micromonospora craniellae]|uniref:LysM domain-containing protein n=1 Tax=Micromonospora craniellae TaxID=2294034 RepID=A0A372FUF3_9ACTN|nr:LysM domain-containing protein [Micromonospora craniellae]QOC94714.1 LysM peptidoglycan-binding domain-containing protein [Micromonospora craniellae]RFS44417.1 LysM domain-containing protein [Micromonospora craniellae]
MAASGGTAVRRVGRVLTGFGALVVLIGLLVGGPIALLAFAGNPLPDHVPTLAEIGTTLTSRDDGQLFLRALAIVGWFGWATFALSVLVELGAQSLRRPAPRLPGMGRQQRAAAALVGSVALIIAASPAATAATTAYTAPTYSAPVAATATLARPATTTLSGPATAFEPVVARAERATSDVPVYKVAKGDYLGKVADRYLDDFEDYRKLAALNNLRDPDRIRPGQLITLPTDANDQGARPHATGRLVGQQARPGPTPEQSRPTPSKPDVEQPESAAPTPPPPAATPQGRPAPHDEAPKDHPPVVTVGAARAGEPDRVNRPLAISAVLAVASIVGAQIGAVLGLRCRPVAVSVPRQPVRRGQPRELPAGRHRKD